MAISYEPELLLARDQGLKLVSIAALVQRPLTSIIALPGKHVTSVASLAGKRVGTAGISYQKAELRTALQHAGVEPGSVHEANVGFNLIPAMLSGQVDATLGGFWNYEAIELRLEHKHPIVIPVNEAGVPNYDELVLVVREEEARTRGQDLRAFLQALTRGEHEVRADPAAASALLVKANPSLEPKLQLESIEQTLPAAVPSEAGKPYGWQDPSAVVGLRELDVHAQAACPRPGQPGAAPVHERVPPRAGDLSVARIGPLTGGGDCPGLNAVIPGRRAQRRRPRAGTASWAFATAGRACWRARREELTLQSTAGILPARRHHPRDLAHQPLRRGARRDGALRARSEFGVDALIPIGGEDTLGVALRLHGEGVPIVGVPKTIDNDLGGTDVTFGFQTAVQIVTDAIDRLHTTAESHNRVMVVEVMGRHAGWIATHAGIAGGADAILVPERPFDIEEVVVHLRRRHARGRSFSIVVVAEGASPREGTLQVRAGAGSRRLRARAPRRDRRGPGGRDRAAHGL